MPLRLNSRSLVLPSRGCVASRVAVGTEALNLTRISPSFASLHFFGNLWPIIDRSSKMPAFTGMDSSRPRAASTTHRWLRAFFMTVPPLCLFSHAPVRRTRLRARTDVLLVAGYFARAVQGSRPPPPRAVIAITQTYYGKGYATACKISRVQWTHGSASRFTGSNQINLDQTLQETRRCVVPPTMRSPP